MNGLTSTGSTGIAGNRYRRGCFRTVLLSLLFIITSVQAFEFEGPFPDHDYPFPVKDSGVEVRIDGDTTVEWLDEERVIFSALAKGEPRMQGAFGAKKQYPGRVVVWNTRTGKVKEHSSGLLWCSHYGWVSIFYAFRNGDFERTKSGPFGNETDRASWKPGDPPKHRDPHTCRIYEGPQKVVAPPDHVVFSLREQDGFLDTGSRNQSLRDRKNPVVLIRPDGTRTELPLLPIEVDGVWWEQWAGVYILAQGRAGIRSRPIRHDEIPFLTPDGKLIQWQVPNEYWRRHTVQGVALTRQGWLLANRDAPTTRFQRTSGGLFLVRNHNVIRIYDGFFGNQKSSLYGTHRGISVSPSGCRIAFKHADIRGIPKPYTTPYTIKMINVCKGE